MVQQITSLEALGGEMPATAAPLETAVPVTSTEAAPVGPPANTTPATPAIRTRAVARQRHVATNSRVLRQAPVLWRFASGQGAFGIFIDERQCWLGNQGGHIFALSHSGQVEE